MHKDLDQDRLNWISESIRKGADKFELLDILNNEGFDLSQSKIALGLNLSLDDLQEIKKSLKNRYSYSANQSIAAEMIKNVPAEIYEVENFLSKEECIKLIQEIKSKLRPSTIASSGEYDPSFRTSKTCDLGYIDNNFIKQIDQKLCDFIGIDSSYGETLQGQHYLEGQEFKSHTDYFEGTQLIEHDKGRGQRTYTFMIYLDNVQKGGETEFTELKRIFYPTQGKALIWNNLNEDKSTNENTMHQAHPIIKGEKTIITKWFRSNSINT